MDFPTSSESESQYIVKPEQGVIPADPSRKRRYTLQQTSIHLLQKGVSVMLSSYYAARANLYTLHQRHPDWSHAELAAALGSSTSWVEKWLKRFRAELAQAIPLEHILPRDTQRGCITGIERG
jgi:hypothetical protein